LTKAQRRADYPKPIDVDAREVPRPLLPLVSTFHSFNFSRLTPGYKSGDAAAVGFVFGAEALPELILFEKHDDVNHRHAG
jgi:hypothetical protein